MNKPEIILALDVDTLEKARYFVEKLYPRIKSFKIGSQLFTAYGPEAVNMVVKKGGRVFLDLKFHDIPKTVHKAVISGSSIGIPMVVSGSAEIGKEAKQAVSLPIFMMTVHIKGGQAMLEEAARGAKEAAEKLKITKPFIVGVTCLTSDDSKKDTLKEVLQAAELAKKSGLDGVVCSALEAAQVRKACGADFIIVTPGIRSSKDALNDQKRTADVKSAVKAGSNFLVIGRPILEANDPIAKTEELLGDL
ncbi:MAG: orotidine-5'-phosphate decarboxylase [Candidatus Omnitrophica bacterium]|nr:orotidine-5'-phosphate decarboxylase [Candidatus Omnitrophota bacterium]